MAKHRTPDEVEMYKCEKCNYQTDRKDNMNQHLLKHKNLDEVNLFKCDQCQYQTVYKKTP